MNRNDVIINNAIISLTNSYGFACYNALYDVFGYKMKRIYRFYEEMTELRESWRVEKVSTVDLLRYAKSKGIDVQKRVESIPLAQRLNFGIKETKKYAPGIDRHLGYALVENYLFSVYVLKEKFKFSNPMLDKFFEKIEFYIDSYFQKQPKSKKRYMNDNTIIEIFRDELSFDIVKGEKL